jgi:3-oxoacyl-(acyl-carrier-protein) synthase
MTAPSATALRRVVFTGMGLVNAAGDDTESVWETILAGKSVIGPARRFDATGLDVNLVAEITDFHPAKQISRRIIAKSDRFAHFALDATGQALADAGLDPDGLDPFRFGISFGNNSGGWDICERGFVEYYREGPSMVNPWQATAWFPTAPQGFVSIQFNVRGWSKSFACDRASGACAAYFALRALRWGHNDVMLVGGSEAPVTRLGVSAHVSTGELSPSSDPDRAYLPYSKSATGLVLGEGSAVLVLEDRDLAIARGARVYGELLAVEQRTGPPDDPRGLEDTLRAALAQAGRNPAQVGLVFGEGCGSVSGDQLEADVLNRVLPGVPVTVPKAAIGHLYGASTGTDIALALLAVRDRVIPATAHAESDPAERSVPLVAVTESRDLDTVVIVSRSREGANVVVVIGRDEAAESKARQHRCKTT